MSTYVSRPVVSNGWELISKEMTKFVNSSKFVEGGDVIVYCFDDSIDSWEKDAAAWYVPKTREICLNMTKILREKRIQVLLAEHPISAKCVTGSSGSEFYALSDKGLRDLERNITFRLAATGLYRESFLRKDDKVGLLDKMPSLDNFIKYHVSLDKTKSNVSERLFSVMLGVIVHETGHSVSSNFLLDSWWSKLSGYDREVLTLMEELRTESLQIARLKGASRLCLSAAYSVVLDIDQQIKDLEEYAAREDLDRTDYVSAVALNSTLTLGRTVYDGYGYSEVERLAIAVEVLVGSDRYSKMFEIWRDYCEIEHLTEYSAKAIADRWSALFPPTDFRSSVAPSTSIHDIVRESGHIVITEDGDTKTESKSDSESKSESESESESESDASDTSHKEDGDSEESRRPRTSVLDVADIGTERTHDDPHDAQDETSTDSITRAVIDAIIVVDRKLSERSKTPHKLSTGAAAFSKIDKRTAHIKNTPPKEDFELARQMSHVLQRIYVSGKDRFHVNSDLPPGRLKSRAAVQNAAYRKQGVQTRKQQWEKTKITVGVNPQLTVGIMTDVSGSQAWAESLSSRVSWILSQAFRTVNARTASVAFGQRVYMPSVPGEPMRDQIVIPALESTEKFDLGLGALDHVLKLTSNLGVKLLFVLTDGIFVEMYENEKADQWVRLLKDAGCTTVWVHPMGAEAGCPPGAVSLPVSRMSVSHSPKVLIEQIIETIEDTLAKSKAG